MTMSLLSIIYIYICVRHKPLKIFDCSETEALSSPAPSSADLELSAGRGSSENSDSPAAASLRLGAIQTELARKDTSQRLEVPC